MRHFVDLDGGRYHCHDERELVAALHSRASTRSASDEAFMQAMAKRFEALTGRSHRTDSFENFVTDLMASGIVREEFFVRP
jgi:hypothetical protein